MIDYPHRLEINNEKQILSLERGALNEQRVAEVRMNVENRAILGRY